MRRRRKKSSAARYGLVTLAVRGAEGQRWSTPPKAEPPGGVHVRPNRALVEIEDVTRTHLQTQRIAQTALERTVEVEERRRGTRIPEVVGVEEVEDVRNQRDPVPGADVERVVSGSGCNFRVADLTSAYSAPLVSRGRQ